MLVKSTALLRGQVVLSEKHSTWSPANETWTALSAENEPYLVRLWKYDRSSAAHDYQRSLWDRELRTLYRIASTPGADESTVTLRAAGVDSDQGCFVMALGADVHPSYPVVSELLSCRREQRWMDLEDPRIRAELWGGLERISRAISLIHDQDLLHRNISASALFFDWDEGPDSFRLGGFEWSVRLGKRSGEPPPTDWPTPPEFFDADWFGYRRSSDWFGFGMLTARLLVDVEHHRPQAPPLRLERVIRDIERTPHLTELERAFVGRLIAIDPIGRLNVAAEIGDRIASIRRGLRARGSTGRKGPLVVAFDPKNTKIIDYVTHLGFRCDPKSTRTEFDHFDPAHVLRLREFLKDELFDCEIYAVPERQTMVLRANRLVLLVRRFDWTNTPGEDARSWDAAYAISPTEVRWSAGGDSIRKLPKGSIAIRFVKELRNGTEQRLQLGEWGPFLPRVSKAESLRSSLAQFRDFLRYTNQLELLMRASEIFQCRVLSRSSGEVYEHLVMKESETQTNEFRLARTGDAGLADYLTGRIKDAELDPEEARDLRLLLTSKTDGPDLSARVEEEDAWECEGIDNAGEIRLRRTIRNSSSATFDEGFVRPIDFRAQIQVIGRRKRAIDALDKYPYLLRSLTAPRQVVIDSGLEKLPVPVPSDAVDTTKQAVMLARIIHEGADFGRHTKASAWYKAVVTQAFSHDGGF